MKTKSFSKFLILTTLCAGSAWAQKKNSKPTWREKLAQNLNNMSQSDVLAVLRDNTSDLPGARDVRLRAKLLDKYDMPLSAFLDRELLAGLKFANASDVESYAETALSFGLNSRVAKRGDQIENALASQKEKVPQSYFYSRAVQAYLNGDQVRTNQFMPPGFGKDLPEWAKYPVLKTKAAMMVDKNNLKEALEILNTDRNWNVKTLQYLNALARAQIAYDLGRFGQVFDEISTIPRNTPAWHMGTLVGSWAAYRKRDVNLALGSLMTLNSPYLISKFSPESHLLEAASLYDLCQYTAAKKSLESYNSRYKNFLRVVEKFEREYGKSLQGVGFVLNYARGAQRAAPGFTQNSWDILMDGLMSQELFLYVDKLVYQTQKESLVWSELSSKNKKLHREFKKSFIRKLESLQNDGLRQGLRPLALGLRRMKQVISESQEMALLVDVEIQTKLRDRVLLGKTALNREIEIDASVNEGFEFWPFEGEYWRDETAHYMYSTVDVCEGT